MRRKWSAKEKIETILIFTLMPLVFCLLTFKMGTGPLAAEKIWGLEHYQGICRQFRVITYSTRGGSYDIGYFDFDDGLTVRCISGNYVECGLTKEALSAVEGTLCDVTYAKAETFGGTHTLFSLSSGGQVLLSEEALRNSFRESAKVINRLLLGCVLVSLLILFLTRYRKETKKSQERRRKRAKKIYDRRKMYLQRKKSKQKIKETANINQ